MVQRIAQGRRPADMILLNDKFSTIVVRCGKRRKRPFFRNLEKTIKTNLSCNIAELIWCTIWICRCFIGMTTPILAVARFY